MPNAVNRENFPSIIYRIEDAVITGPDAIAVFSTGKLFSAGRSRHIFKLFNCLLNRIIVGWG